MTGGKCCSYKQEDTEGNNHDVNLVFSKQIAAMEEHCASKDTKSILTIQDPQSIMETTIM